MNRVEAIRNESNGIVEQQQKGKKKRPLKVLQVPNKCGSRTRYRHRYSCHRSINQVVFRERGYEERRGELCSSIRTTNVCERNTITRNAFVFMNNKKISGADCDQSEQTNERDLKILCHPLALAEQRRRRPTLNNNKLGFNKEEWGGKRLINQERKMESYPQLNFDWRKED